MPFGLPMKTWRCTGSVLRTISERHVVVDRHAPPAEDLETLLAHDARPHALAMRAQALVPRHEHMADGVVARSRQREADFSAFVL